MRVFKASPSSPCCMLQEHQTNSLGMTPGCICESSFSKMSSAYSLVSIRVPLLLHSFADSFSLVYYTQDNTSISHFSSLFYLFISSPKGCTRKSRFTQSQDILKRYSEVRQIRNSYYALLPEKSWSKVVCTIVFLLRNLSLYFNRLRICRSVILVCNNGGGIDKIFYQTLTNLKRQFLPLFQR